MRLDDVAGSFPLKPRLVLRGCDYASIVKLAVVCLVACENSVGARVFGRDGSAEGVHWCREVVTLC